MTNTLSRSVAAAVAAVLLSAVSVLTMTEAAHAVTVAGPSWDSGVDIHLTSAETSSAISQGSYATLGMCTSAINQAISAGVSFPDVARSNCVSALEVCARDARGAGRALSAARLYVDGSHKCLVV